MLNKNNANNDFLSLDKEGRLIIVESNKSMSTNLFLALLFTMLVLISLWYWFQRFYGSLLPLEETILHIPAFLGLFCTPLSVLFCLAFIFPRKLSIDRTGIEYQKLGFSTRINWDDITDIVGKSNIAWVGQPGPQVRSEVTITIVSRNKKISFSPIFNVSQQHLLAFLKGILSDQSNTSEHDSRVQTSVIQKGTPDMTQLQKFLIFFAIVASIITLKILFPHSAFLSQRISP